MINTRQMNTLLFSYQPPSSTSCRLIILNVLSMASQVITFWPKSITPSRKMALIEQIVYSIPGNDTADGFIEVWATNIFKDEEPYAWQKIPAFYKVHLLRMFLRMELMLKAMKIDDLEESTSALINKNIVYLDKVLDKVWMEARKAEDSMTDKWRSDILDGWMIIEFVVGRHDHGHIDSLEDIGDLGQDVEDLGKYCILLQSFSIINIYHTDWDDYDERTDYIIRGDQYGFDINTLSVDPDIIYRFVAIWLEDTTVSSQQFPGMNKSTFTIQLTKILTQYLFLFLINLKASHRRQNLFRPNRPSRYALV